MAHISTRSQHDFAIMFSAALNLIRRQGDGQLGGNQPAEGFRGRGGKPPWTHDPIGSKAILTSTRNGGGYGPNRPGRNDGGQRPAKAPPHSSLSKLRKTTITHH